MKTETWVRVQDVIEIIEKAKSALDYKHEYTRGKYDALIDKIVTAVVTGMISTTYVTEEERDE